MHFHKSAALKCSCKGLKMLIFAVQPAYSLSKCHVLLLGVLLTHKFHQPVGLGNQYFLYSVQSITDSI